MADVAEEANRALGEERSVVDGETTVEAGSGRDAD